MKRFMTLIWLFLVLPCFCWGQHKTHPPRPWMFTLEETIQLPGVNQEEMAERAAKFRRQEHLASNQNIDCLNYQTKQKVIEYHSSIVKLNSGRKQYSLLITTSVAIIPGNGYYTVQMQRVDATGYRGNWRVFDDTIRCNDDGPNNGFSRWKAKEDVPDLVKDYCRQQFNALLPRIREFMDNSPVEFDYFHSY